MTIVAVGSLKGAPGATTLAMLLTGLWPRASLLVEADPDGGAIAARAGISATPGLASLAAACRHESSADVTAHLQRVGTIEVAPAPPGAERVRAALASGGHLAPTLAGAAHDVVVDCGRLTPGTPAAPLLSAAELVLVVCRPNLDELQHLPARTDALHEAETQLRLVLIGDRPYSQREVEAGVGVPVVGVLPHDAKAAITAATGRFDDPGLRRSRLVRGCTGVVDRLLADLGRDSEVAPS